MPRYQDDDDDDYDDRPRRKKSRKKNNGGGTTLIIAGGGVAVLALAVGLFFALRGGPANKPQPGDAPGGAAGGANAGGAKYVPRESEKRLADYQKAQGDRRLTEAEVVAVMGEPTRRGKPATILHNGATITAWDVFWEVPGSGISSKMTFGNGVEISSVIGLEIDPPK